MSFKKLTALTAAVAITTGVVYAADQSVDVTAAFRQAITLTKNFDLAFSSVDPIDFAGTPAGTDLVQLATSGAITYGGVAFSGPSTGQAADVSISGDGVSPVEVSCSTGATMAHSGGTTVTVDQLQISMNTGDAFGAADYTCAGVGTTPHVHTLDGTDKVLMGGRLVGNATIVNGAYSTATAGGAAATVRVVYQ